MNPCQFNMILYVLHKFHTCYKVYKLQYIIKLLEFKVRAKEINAGTI